MWYNDRKRLTVESVAPDHETMDAIGIELQRRTDAAGKAPPDVRIDFLTAEGRGAIAHDAGRVVIWGDALAGPAVPDKVLDSLTIV